MAPRSKPMKLIVGGYPRTGTNSIIAALKILGFTPYEYPTRLERSELGWWASQLQNKYNSPKTQLVLDRERLDRMTGDYDCITDAPCFLLVEEIAAAYPEAKILLNERDVDRWLESIQKTLQPAYEEDQRWTSKPLQYLDPSLARPIMLCDAAVAATICDYDYTKTDLLRARFAQHYLSLTSTICPSRLLSFKVQDGWAPLCTFLSITPPPKNIPFPWVNDSAELIESGQGSWLTSWKNGLRNLGIGSGVVAMAVYFVVMRS